MNNKNVVVTITGGTGSFGSTMVRHLLQKDINEIRVFSRDENKQDAMRLQLKDERVRFFLGDVRDYESTAMAIKGSDYANSFQCKQLRQILKVAKMF